MPTTSEIIIAERLALDYGIRDVPAEWLAHAVWKHVTQGRSRFALDLPTIAFMIANEWQRGLTTPAATL